MANRRDLILRVLSADTRQERVQAFATLVMWFAAGALVYSAVTPFFYHLPTGSAWDAAGGAATIALAEAFRFG